MKFININSNKDFHMIPLWKSPIKLPVDLPVELPVDVGFGPSLWTMALEPRCGPASGPVAKSNNPLQNKTTRCETKQPVAKQNNPLPQGPKGPKTIRCLTF